MATASPTPAPKQRTFLGHPPGLFVLFFTEMWERFSYYGMRALLMLYMLNYLRWSQKEASEIYKIYTSLVYVTPILGGYLADRWLGNRLAVIIGAALMSIGHFLMAFEEYPIFLSALIFLIIGNGFFKPNMSVQVGRLYPANDGRRDGAYTIFYMGINLGAFLSPLICGWLAEKTVGGFHSGFTMAGIGMVLGMVIYLVGQPLVRELPHDAVAEEKVKQPGEKSEAITEAAAGKTPSVLGKLSGLVPGFLFALAILSFVLAPFFFFVQEWSVFDALMVAIGGACLALVAYVCARVQGAVRDRVLVILLLGIFVMFFWAAFEQAGNVLNIWADQHTDRFLSKEATEPQVSPEVIEDKPKTEQEKKDGVAQPGVVERFVDLFRNMVTLKESDEPTQTWGEWFESSFNPVPTAWFQSINALAIFILAPLFAWLWITLDRRGYQPSIPMKMTLGLVFMSASMVIMMEAAREENQVTTQKLTEPKLPEGIQVNAEKQLTYIADGKTHLFQAGRLTYDASANELTLRGVLPENERDNLIEQTVLTRVQEAIKELVKKSQDINGKDVKSVSVKFLPPPGFDMKYAGLKKSVVQFNKADQTLVAYQPLAEKESKGLLVAAGQPEFRDSIHRLFVGSTKLRVTSWWLFWSYILATLGELCLSPVGLSMVSKLAPAKFATMLMGVWLLTSSFGNFAAGLLGEIWGTIPPIQFFLLSAAVVGGAALALLILVRVIVKMMHGVN